MSDVKIDKEKLYADIWPMERDVISRPERLKYIRRIGQPETCVFCKAHQQGPSFESLLLYKNDLAMVVLNKFPYNSGHLLVLPVRHCGEITGLTDDEFIAVNQLLRHALASLEKAYNCAGINVGLNQGRVAGAGIPDHLHWHVIPRWLGDTNFFPLVAETRVLPENLEQAYNRLVTYFSDLSD